MQFYQVVITGLICTGDGEPSPKTWSWAPEHLSARFTQDMQGVDIDFKALQLVPNLDDFTEASDQEFKDHLLRDGLMVGTHDENCKWPDESCLCQG
mgnify:FL=1